MRILNRYYRVTALPVGPCFIVHVPYLSNVSVRTSDGKDTAGILRTGNTGAHGSPDGSEMIICMAADLPGTVDLKIYPPAISANELRIHDALDTPGRVRLNSLCSDTEGHLSSYSRGLGLKCRGK